MTSAAEFGIKINVNGRQAAVDDIDKVTEATARVGETAQASSTHIDKVTEATARAGETAQTSTQQINKVTEATARGGETAQTGTQQINKVTEATARMGATAQTGAQQMAAAQKDLGATTAQLTIGQLKFLDSLRDQAAASGLSRTELLKLQAAELGISQAAAEHIKRIEAANDAQHKFSLATAGSTRELMVLAHEAVTGNFSRLGGSMMVLANQAGLAQLAFSGTGMAIVGATAAVAGLVMAIVHGHEEMVAMNNALAVTSNYSGQTRSSVDALAESMTRTKEVTIGTAKQVVAELVASGRIGQQSIAQIAHLASDFAKATGKDIEKITPELIKLFADPARGAEELNQSMHFLTVTDQEHIRTLERLGQTQEAQRVLAEKLTAHLPRQAENVGTVTKAVNEQVDAWTKLIQKIKDWGKVQTPSEKAQALRDQLSTYKANGVSRKDPNFIAIEKQLEEQEKLEAAEKATAKASAEAAAANQLQAQSWDAIKKSSQLYRAQELQDQLNLVRQNKPENDSQLAQKLDAERRIGKEIVDLYRSMGAEGRQLAEEQAASALRLAELRIKGETDQIETEYALGKITKDQLDLRMTNVALEDNAAKQQYERQVLRVGGLSKQEEQQHKNKLKWLQEEWNVIEQKGVNKQLVDEKKAYDDIIKSVLNVGDAEIKRLDEAIRAQKLHNAEIGQTAAQKELARKAIEDEKTAQLESDAAFLQRVLNENQFDDKSRAAYETRLNMLREEIAKRRELSALLNQGAALEEAAKAKADLDKFLDPTKAKAFGDTLAGAFHGATDALSKLTAALEGHARGQAEIEKQRANAAAAYQKGVKDDAAYAKALQQINMASAREQIGAYGNMAGAAAGFFNEHSRGYQTLMAVSQAFHAAELAMTMAEMVPKAISAILTQGEGDPYTAFPRMAAMAALVAGLGVAVGGIGSGGMDVDIAKERQTTQGTGTVLGDASAKSDSMTKSLDLLSKNSSIELTVSQGMLTSLRSIESSIGGLAQIVFRTTGLTSGNNMGIQEGTISRSTGDGLLKSLGLGSLDFLHNGIRSIPVVGTLVKGLESLWGKTTQEIVDSGIAIHGSVASLIQGQGIQQYTDVKKTESSWFGLKKDTSMSTVFGDLDETVTRQLGLVFQNLSTVIVSASGTLGKNTSAIAQQIDNFVLDLGKVSLRGLKGQELQDAINAVISSASDSVAHAVLPELDAFQKVGEGYFQTVIRTVNGIETANAALKKLGIAAIDYNVILNKQGDVATEIVRQSIAATESYQRPATEAEKMALRIARAFAHVPFDVENATVSVKNGIGQIIDTLDGSANDLIEVYRTLLQARQLMRNTGLNGGDLGVSLIGGAGGIQELNSSLSDYLDKFFSESEKAAAKIDNVREQFAKLGLAMPNSKEAFRKLVDSIGTATDDAARLTGAVLALSGAFADAQDAAAQAEQERQRAADTAEQERKQAIEDARNAVAAAYQRESSAIQTTIDKFAAFSKSLRQFRDSLLTGNLSALSPLLKYQELRDRFDRTYSLAKAGDENALGQLQGVAQDFLQASQAVNASSEAYAQDFARVSAALEASAKSADVAANFAAIQLTVLQQSVSGITQVNNSVLSVRDAIVQYFNAGGTRSASTASAAGASSGANASLGAAGGGVGWSNNSAYNHPSGVSVSANDPALLTAAKLVYQSATGGVSTAQFNNAAAAVGGDIYAATGWDGDPQSFRAKWKFAKGGVFTNGVVSQPTYFDMGEMGEAGAEAIMPLVRTSKGLGVRAHGVNSDADNSEMAAAIDRQTSVINRSIETMERLMEMIAEGQMRSSDDLRMHLQHVSHVMSRAKVTA